MKIFTILLTIFLVSCTVHPKNGILVEKRVIPAYTSFVFHKIGDVSIATPIHHPKRYQLVLKNENLVWSIYVDYLEFERSELGQEVYVR